MQANFNYYEQRAQKTNAQIDVQDNGLRIREPKDKINLCLELIQ